ncbi:MAG TPA: D-2-hydroxyacid dehydrogenase [Syntrophomonas sp.]|nr:D-2-hydroxyacid dehydrogenase [Syntrophomonas sp.]
MKIIVLDGYTANPGDLSWNQLEELGELTVYDRTAPNLIADRIGDAEAVFTNKTPLSAEVFAACPSIRYVGVLATGYNIVDVEAARERGIVVSNVPAYSTDSVVQLVFAFLLEICHHTGAHSDAVHAGAWGRSPDFCFWNYPLMELAGKTMGIIGYGGIGKAVGQVAEAFGMEVIASVSRNHEEGRVPLDTLLERSDVITLHCPLTPQTEGLICRDTIAKMKDGAILINTSRGPVVNEKDLADALISGKIYAAGIDVVSEEPIRNDNPLLTAPNCFITPHIGWAPLESRRRLLAITADNFKAFLRGKPVNVVNGR